MAKWYVGMAILCGLGSGCSQSTDPYLEQADAVEQAAAALEAVDDTDIDAVAAGEEPRFERRDRRAAFVSRHRRSFRRLMSHVEPGALLACREEAQSCREAEEGGCRPEVRACVRAAMEDAVESLCADGEAMCTEADAPARACERIEKRCAMAEGEETEAETSDSTDTDDEG